MAQLVVVSSCESVVLHEPAFLMFMFRYRVGLFTTVTSCLQFPGLVPKALALAICLRLLSRVSARAAERALILVRTAGTADPTAGFPTCPL